MVFNSCRLGTQVGLGSLTNSLGSSPMRSDIQQRLQVGVRLIFSAANSIQMNTGSR